MTRDRADAVVAKVASALTPGTFEVAGSYRRGKATVGDIDIVSKESPRAVNPRLRPIAEAMINEGEQKTSIRILGERVDIRFTDPESFGSMLIYLTGSKDFNIRLRAIAIDHGLKLERVRARGAGGRGPPPLPRRDLTPRYPRPPLHSPGDPGRPGRDRAGPQGDLPILVEAKAIRGDLHVHTTATDGRTTLGDLAAAGTELGYEYLLVSDHSPGLHITHGLDVEGVKAQGKEIERINRSSGCQLLAGIEVDIMADGTLGLPDQVLGDLDLVIASVHVGLHEEKDTMTRRLLTAVSNENVDILGHPTGRLFPQRAASEIDLARVMDAAKGNGVALEINASPYRMDLDDPQIREARDQGLKLAIGTDAHEKSELGNIGHGVALARRGWCGPGDILNTLELEALLRWAS